MTSISPLTALRLQLFKNGYTPIPITDPDYQHDKVLSPGKQPFFRGWQKISRDTLTPDVIRSWEHIRKHTNTGLLCGALIGLDLDLPVPELAARIATLADELLGATSLMRIGKAPKMLRCYRALVPMKKMESPELLLDDGTVVQVEVMGVGQQVLAYGIHPATMQPYRWPESGPDVVPLDDLPVATEERLRAFLAAVEIILRDAGGLTKKERDKLGADDGPLGDDPPPRKEEITEDNIHSDKRSHTGTDKGAFFREVNKAALANTEPWFRALFSGCWKEEGTDCWRVASFDLGRSLEEDISVHPTRGGHDFGTRESCSPIDLVMAWGGAPKPADAALYLCEKLGIDPATLGWKPKREKPEEAKQTDARGIDWGDPVDFLADESLGTPELEQKHIPEALWPFVTDTSVRMGVDPACVALAALVSCASATSDEWSVQPKRNDYTWTEQARIWGAIVGDPSILKTPIISACTRPIDKLEIEARKRHQEEMRQWRRDCEMAKADKQPQPQQPKLDRYMVEGTTPEALSEVLRDDDEAKMRAPLGKVLSRHDEMSEFFGGLDKYKAGGKGGSERGNYLRLFNGGRWTIDRIGRGSFAISNWSACFLGGCQPGPIQRIARDAADDGLLQRFNYAVPGPQRPGLDQRPDHDAVTRYGALFPALAAMRPGKQIGSDQAQWVVLSENAHQHRERIDALRVAMSAMPDATARLKSAYGKWPGTFARLCLIFHMIEIADRRARGDTSPMVPVITGDTAGRVASYMQDILLPHLLRAEAVMFSTDQTGHARWIAGFILAHKLEKVAIRDITRAYGALRQPEAKRELLSVMDGLVAVAWLEPEEPTNLAKGVTSWIVNPAVHQVFAARADAEAERRADVKRQIAEAVALIRKAS